MAGWNLTGNAVSAEFDGSDERERKELSVSQAVEIAAGALDGVDAIFGQHVWSEVDAGTFSAEPGSRMGNTDWFRIDIEGVSAHGSMPHKGCLLYTSPSPRDS